MPLLEGGMTTRRSGLRLFMPRFPPGGGGDFVGMTLPRPFPPPLVPSRLGEALEFTNPFPARGETNCKTEKDNIKFWCSRTSYEIFILLNFR